MTILVADVGGTNTRVALCPQDSAKPEAVQKFRNSEFASLSDVLSHYLAAQDNAPCSAACVAVAGPVTNGVGRMTNLDWAMDADTLTQATGASVGYVINDLEAQGHAIDHVETRRILGNAPKADPDAARLVVGMGTGFNAAPVHTTGSHNCHVVPSECGHIGLPVWDATSFGLSQDIASRHGFASIEEALSGRGLMCVHRYVAQSPEDILPDTGAVIAAMAKGDTAVARHTADLFCQLFGRVIGDQALIHLPWGGIYVIGGLASAMSPFFENHGFSAGFFDKGRFSEFMKGFNIDIIDDDFSALTGCAAYALRHI